MPENRPFPARSSGRTTGRPASKWSSGRTGRIFDVNAPDFSAKRRPSRRRSGGRTSLRASEDWSSNWTTVRDDVFTCIPPRSTPLDPARVRLTATPVQPRTGGRPAPASAFDPALGQARDELLLQQHKNRHDGNRRDERARREHAPAPGILV